jgi:hypothetical protein
VVGVGVSVGIGVRVKVGVQLGVKVKVGCGVLKVVGVGVVACTISVPTEQPRVNPRPTNPKTAKRVTARFARLLELFSCSKRMAAAQSDEFTFS